MGLFAFTMAVPNWKVKEDECVVEFTGGRISGTFKALKADIVFDKDHLDLAKIMASIEVPSIATGFFLKNSHAKDALDADKYPDIKFTSVTVTKNGSAYIAKGNLNMKGVSKPVNINFTFEEKGNQGVFKGSFKVVPKDFGVTRSGTPDEVSINLVVPVVKA